MREIHNVFMEKFESYPPVSDKWAGIQARAILAVDNIKATPEGEKLAQAVEDREISYEEAIQMNVNRAYDYASSMTIPVDNTIMVEENDDDNDYIDPYIMDNGALKNRFNIKDTRGINDAEADFTRLVIQKILKEPIPTHFDTSYIKQLHHRLFANVYDWAGEFRTVGITKGGTNFLPPEQIEGELDKVFGALSEQKKNFINNIELFSQYTGEMLVKINYIHPFREGNGRTQRLLMSKLAQYAGITIEWETISEGIMRSACIDGIEGNTRKMTRLILLNSKINMII